MTNKQSINSIRLLDEKITRKDYKKLINIALEESTELNLDLSGINSMSSQELSELIYFMQYAKQKNVKLFFICVSEILKHFFELTRTEHFFSIRLVKDYAS